MHSEPMSESEGNFITEWQLSDRPCPFCGKEGKRFWKTWESNDEGYSDEKNECRECGRTWWVEGPDA